MPWDCLWSFFYQRESQCFSVVWRFSKVLLKLFVRGRKEKVFTVFVLDSRFLGRQRVKSLERNISEFELFSGSSHHFEKSWHPRVSKRKMIFCAVSTMRKLFHYTQVNPLVEESEERQIQEQCCREVIAFVLGVENKKKSKGNIFIQSSRDLRPRHLLSRHCFRIPSTFGWKNFNECSINVSCGSFRSLEIVSEFFLPSYLLP